MNTLTTTAGSQSNILDDDFWRHFEGVEFWTPGKRDIHAVGLGGCTPLLWATLAAPASFVFKLIEAGSNIHQLDEIGRSCLHYAANSNRPDLVKLFLELGVDPLIQDQKKKTAWDLVKDEPTPEVNAILGPVMDAIATQKSLHDSLPLSPKTSFTPRM